MKMISSDALSLLSISVPVKLKTHPVDVHLQDVMLSGGSDAAIIPIGASPSLLFPGV